MSSLIFHTEQNQVLIATDTLATSYEGDPAYFTTKAFIMPHLRMIICGTGIAGFLGEWFIRINDRLVLNGIDNLDCHTTKNLRLIRTVFKKKHTIPNNLTTTIYHFGFSEEDNTIHSYVYRSINNFRSEKLAYGTGIKPEIEINRSYKIPDDIKLIMTKQRESENNRPKNDRVYIGGEIQIHQLTNDGFYIYTLDKFENYYETKKIISYNYHLNNNKI